MITACAVVCRFALQRAAAWAVLCGLGTAQVEPPAEGIIRDLARVATSMSTVTMVCRNTQQAAIDPAELIRRWRVDRSLLAPSRHFVTFSGHRFRVARDAALSGRRDAAWSRHEIAFDGANLHIASHDGSYEIMPPRTRAVALDRSTRLFAVDYFDSIRVRIPDLVADLGSLPRSEILSTLSANQAACVRYDEPALIRVDESTPEGRRSSWLDPELGHAVVRWEEYRNERCVRRVVCRDFVPLADVHVPRETETVWYSWHTVPDDVAETPLLHAWSRIESIEPCASDAALAVSARAAGSVIHDGRLDAATSATRGFYTYTVPIEAEQLLTAFSRTNRGTPLAADGVSLRAWILIHAASLAAFAVGLRIRRKS